MRNWISCCARQVCVTSDGLFFLRCCLFGLVLVIGYGSCWWHSLVVGMGPAAVVPRLDVVHDSSLGRRVVSEVVVVVHHFMTPTIHGALPQMGIVRRDRFRFETTPMRAGRGC